VKEWLSIPEAATLVGHINALRAEHGEPLSAADLWAADTARALEDA
jgi:predicted nucleic acid-binding protein